MGSPASEPHRQASHEKQHRVILDHNLLFSAYEVTREQFAKVMGDDPGGPLTPGRENEPVRGVTHDQAVEFCRRLSARDRRSYRLPTEAEWEYACRAGTTGSFAGTGSADDMAWHLGSGARTPMPVGLKKANDWGLYDMHGNVSEWCEDTFAPYRTDKPQRNPVSRAKTFQRMARGGDCNSPWHLCRSAQRLPRDPHVSDPFTGFRPVLEE